MTNMEATWLQNTKTAEEFLTLAGEYRMRVAGPSDRGCFLAEELGGRTWLFSGYPSAPSKGINWGRTMLPSVWTPLNVASIEGRDTSQYL
jgi:hypothetical protein